MEILTNTAPDGQLLQATFLPEKGMNLISYMKEQIEVIDQTTRSLLEERNAGMGALIGPHFHEQAHPPHDFDETLFPHIPLMKKQGRKDFFSHGIGRYVPWKYVKSKTQILAELKGTDLYRGIPLKNFEGQDFHMKYNVRLLSEGLFLSLSIQSEKPSVVGLHTYYALSGKGVIQGEVDTMYRTQDQWLSLPSKWTQKRPSHLHFELPQEADFGVTPKKRCETDHEYQMNLLTSTHEVHIKYCAASDQEISCQVFSPKSASYVCIEPLSARTPPHPVLSQNHLEVTLQIFTV